MSTELTLFHFDDGRESFEDLGKTNGVTHWREADVMTSLGYQSKDGFRKALTRAKQACLTLGWNCEDHFHLQADGEHLITRFGCYLVAMNGDSKKPQVAAAQAYFAAIAETFQSHLEHADGIDRLLIREEVADGEKSLSSTAMRQGIQNFAFFKNKGYLGMYNMNFPDLCKFKGVPAGQSLIDRMSKPELAAHLFRVTQTDEKIKNENIRGQFRLEHAAHEVGRKVRKTMLELGSGAPEHIPLAEPVQQVRRKIKGTQQKFKAIDRKKGKKTKE